MVHLTRTCDLLLLSNQIKSNLTFRRRKKEENEISPSTDKKKPLQNKLTDKANGILHASYTIDYYWFIGNSWALTLSCISQYRKIAINLFCCGGAVWVTSCKCFVIFTVSSIVFLWNFEVLISYFVWTILIHSRYFLIHSLSFSTRFDPFPPISTRFHPFRSIT